GLMHLSGLDSSLAQRLLEERDVNGPYESLDDFMVRVPEAGPEQLGILLKINAFRFTGKSRRELLWEAYLKAGSYREEARTASLFRVPGKNYSLPQLSEFPLEK